MLKFYRNCILSLVVLLLFSAACLYVGWKLSALQLSLFPYRESSILWVPAIEPKAPVGKTQLSVKRHVGTVEYDFFLDSDTPFPYTHYSIYFVDSIQSFLELNLKKYSSIKFKIQCDPKNVLQLVLFSFDERVTRLSDMTSRRVSSAAFSCNANWNEISVDFTELVTPQWWLERNGLEFSDRNYRLDRTMGFAWVNSLQSPLNTRSNVKLTDIQIVGRDYRPLVIIVVGLVAVWGVTLVLLVRHYIRELTQEIKSRLKLDQPLIAYKKLSIAPQKDKEKAALLRYMATKFSDPELSLESAVSEVGLNRTKVNELLKEELGLTFSAYLNKLRLTEAARLLSESPDANVSEIAYVVGYNNASYFNKLFKSEYGCAPKTFKSLYFNSPSST